MSNLKSYLISKIWNLCPNLKSILQISQPLKHKIFIISNARLISVKNQSITAESWLTLRREITCPQCAMYAWSDCLKKIIRSSFCSIRNSRISTALVYNLALLCDSLQFQVESRWISNRIPVESCAFKSNTLVFESNASRSGFKSNRYLALPITGCYVRDTTLYAGCQPPYGWVKRTENGPINGSSRVRCWTGSGSNVSREVGRDLALERDVTWRRRNCVQTAASQPGPQSFCGFCLASSQKWSVPFPITFDFSPLHRFKLTIFYHWF